MVLEVKLVAYICCYLVKNVTSVIDPGVELLCCETYILFLAFSASYQVDYASRRAGKSTQSKKSNEI